MNTIEDQIQSRNLLKIKKIIDQDNNCIKIRIESSEKSVCLSVHEFGKYDGGNLE